MNPNELTPKTLIEEIESYPVSYYIYDTSPERENQVEFIRALENELKTRLKVIGTKDNLEGLLDLKNHNFKLLVIRNTDKIINQMENLEPFEILFEILKEKDIALLLFFNNKVRGSKIESWFDLSEKKIELYEGTIELPKEPVENKDDSSEKEVPPPIEIPDITTPLGEEIEISPQIKTPNITTPQRKEIKVPLTTEPPDITTPPGKKNNIIPQNETNGFKKNMKRIILFFGSFVIIWLIAHFLLEASQRESLMYSIFGSFIGNLIYEICKK